VTGVVSAVLVTAGVLVTVCSALAGLLLRRTFLRLHLLTPVSTVAAPLIGLGLAVANGWSLTTATDLLVAAVMALTGPALGAATGRLVAQHDSLVSDDPPG
jgi:multisubunit Na+/H+ antiporter MnhG subunit